MELMGDHEEKENKREREPGKKGDERCHFAPAHGQIRGITFLNCWAYSATAPSGSGNYKKRS